MRNIAIVNGIDLRPQALRPLLEGQSSLSRALEFGRALPGVADVVIFLSSEAAAAPAARNELPPGVRPVSRASWALSEMLDEMIAAAEGFDHLFYFHADCPFLDRDLADRMMANHVRYWADYTFADGYPAGVSTEILTPQTLKRLRTMAGEGGVPRRDSLFAVLKKDINSFDVETEISPEDLRLLRLSLTADSERNFLLLSRVVASGARTSPEAVAFLRDQPLAHRTLPAFFPIQIVERCPQACSYCPYPGVGGDILHRQGRMPVETFSALASKIATFAGDAVIDISLWGEPSLHPQITEIVAAALREPGIDLVIETAGVGWPPGAIERIAQGHRTPRWIVSLDASNEAQYRRLRGEGFAEAVHTAEKLLELFPQRAWVQAVRMKENEEDLETFYRTWKGRTENVIIQKYDSFGGMLPDRMVADLSPLGRFPCWHLKRDLAILLDGTVPLCREDLRVSVRLGNALQDELAVIWDAAREVYASHVAATYPGVCAACDEYYTFNF